MIGANPNSTCDRKPLHGPLGLHLRDHEGVESWNAPRKPFLVAVNTPGGVHKAGLRAVQPVSRPDFRASVPRSRTVNGWP